MRLMHRGADGLTAGVIGLLCDLLYDPYLQDGLFCAAYVEGERGNLIDRIAALKTIRVRGRRAD